jgi:hypothetical protein
MADGISKKGLEIVMGDPADGARSWVAQVAFEECDAAKASAASPPTKSRARAVPQRCQQSVFVPPPWKTPLEADAASKRPPANPLSRSASIMLYLRTTEHAFRDAQGKSYKIAVRAPKGFLSECAQKEFLRVVEDLNKVMVQPVTKFYVLFRSAYDVTKHEVGIASRYQCDEMPRDVRVLGDLVHEMAHGISYKRGFTQDKDWGTIHDLGLGWGNNEIIDDSNYYAGVDDSLGHPHTAPTESFASALTAFYLHADKFRDYIQHRDTPERMRAFGKLVWCFMRERVFAGRVFTSDGRDPFKGESTAQLLNAQRPQRAAALQDAMNHKDILVAAVDRFDPEMRDAAPALIRMVRDQKKDAEMRAAAAAALRRIGPGVQGGLAQLLPALADSNAHLASLVADAVGSCGPTARSAEAALLDVIRKNDKVSFRSFVGALRRIGADLSAAVLEMTKRLDDKNEEGVIENAIAGLAEAGPAASPALDRLLPLLKKEDYAPGAILAMGSMGAGTKGVLQHLQKLLQDEKHELYAAMALLHMDREHHAAARVLVKSFRDPRSIFYREPVQNILRERVVPVLIRELANKAPKVRSYAAFLLSTMGIAALPALPHLEKARNDPDEVVREHAKAAVRWLGRAAAEPELHRPFYF